MYIAPPLLNALDEALLNVSFLTTLDSPIPWHPLKLQLIIFEVYFAAPAIAPPIWEEQFINLQLEIINGQDSSLK